MKHTLIALAMTSVCVAAGLTAATLPAQAAAATACTGTADTIYTSPATPPGVSGKLISCRRVILTEVTDGPPVNSWQVQYASKNALDRPIAVSGTIIVPRAKWTRGGTRPVIAFAPGTLGLGSQCAMSKQLAGAYQDMYEGANIGSFLNAGFAVAQTDGVGYLNGQVHQYMVGESSGHALLDVARAAFQVPGAGLDKRTEIGISGYSQGGHTSLWGAQLADRYAPELTVVGAAAGGVPGDLKRAARSLDGGLWAGFMADAVIGVQAAYPALPLDSIASPAGRAAIVKAKQLCLIGTLTSFVGTPISTYTTAGLSLDQLFLTKGSDGVSWGERIAAQEVGVGVGTQVGAKYRITFPVFQYRGFADGIIDAKAEESARDSYCRAGVRTRWQQYPGEHLSTDLQASPDVTKWFTDRFTSTTPEPGNC